MRFRSGCYYIASRSPPGPVIVVASELDLHLLASLTSGPLPTAIQGIIWIEAGWNAECLLCFFS